MGCGLKPAVAKATERCDFPLQECPTGLVDEDTFKLIYSQFFPQGGKSKAWLPHSPQALTHPSSGEGALWPFLPS